MNVKHAKTLTNRSTLFPKRYKMTINISSDSNLEQLRSEHKSLISEKIQLTKADKVHIYIYIYITPNLYTSS
jgi:hypothetical protein